MSKAEIIAELPKLKAEERTQAFQRLCELHEADILRGAGPTEEERKLLDEALAAFEQDGDRRMPWHDHPEMREQNANRNSNGEF